MNSRSKISGPRRSDSVLDGSTVRNLSSIDPGSTVRNLSSIDPGEGGTVVRIDDRIKSQIAAMGVRVGTSIGRKMAEGIEVAVER